MALAVLIAGLVALVAGLLAILYGIPIREFSVGSTFILVGALGVCTGMLLAGLYVVVTELKAITRRLAGTAAASDVRVRPVLPGSPTAGMTAPEPADTMQVEPTPSAAPSIPAAPPWQDAAGVRERPRVEAPPMPPMPAPPEPATEAPRRRNLLFESTSRKERERAQAKVGEGLPLEPPGVPASVAPPQPSPANFDDAWPKPDRMRPPETSLQRRPPMPPPAPRTPAAATEPAPPPAQPAAQPAPAPAEQPAVTVLKSGVVDGMAYSLYSDGSIEAQMPEGMMRFASIDELRSHLDQRG
jgi:hypothetical protein